MRINPKQPSRRLNFLGISLFIFLNSIYAKSQTVPIGFFEGLMGNSGLAISDSSASSFYNPSLILNKRTSSYSFGGNTFANFNSKANDDQMSSSKISPSYISSIHIFESFAHEFFLTNTTSIEADTLKSSVTGALIRSNIRQQDYQLGYGFAFPGLPMGFQTSVRYRDNQISTLSEFQDNLSAFTTQANAANRQADFMVAIGGNHQFSNYRFGYKFSSRGLAIYKKNEGRERKYSYTQISNQYIKSESDFSTDQESIGELIAIGHGFKINDHEFLTDTRFEELVDLAHAYNWSQTFGYKLSSAAGYQYMCGASHLINKDIKYFGQSMYVSTGFSWQSRSSRSAVGMYYSVDKLKFDTQVYGLTFSSEFIY